MIGVTIANKPYMPDREAAEQALAIADAATSEKLATTRERFAAFVEDLAAKL